jgi:hypothetical protein
MKDLINWIGFIIYVKEVFEDHTVFWLKKDNVSKDLLLRKETVKQNGKKFQIPHIQKFLVDEIIVNPNGEELGYGTRMGKPYVEIREGDGTNEPDFLIIDWSKLDRNDPGSKITMFAVNIMKPTNDEIKDKVLALKHSTMLNESIERYEKKLAKFSSEVIGIPVVITKKGMFDFLKGF